MGSKRYQLEVPSIDTAATRIGRKRRTRNERKQEHDEHRRKENECARAEREARDKWYMENLGHLPIDKTASPRCRACMKEKPEDNFVSVWIGQEYISVCKSCLEKYGPTGLRDMYGKHVWSSLCRNANSR